MDEVKAGNVRWIVTADRHRKLIESNGTLKQALTWQKKEGLVIDDGYASRSECDCCRGAGVQDKAKGKG
eukprot:2233668-Pyramimonas_sp.AAC.1